MNRPKYFGYVIMGLTVLVGCLIAPKIHFDGSESTTKLVSNSALEEFNNFQNQFPKKQSGSIAIITSKNRFNRFEDFLLLDEITSLFEQDKTINNVSSITNLIVPKRNMLSIDYIHIIKIQEKYSFKNSWYELIVKKDIYSKFISRDTSSSLIFLSHTGKRSDKLNEKLDNLLAQHPGYTLSFFDLNYASTLKNTFYREMTIIGVSATVIVLFLYFFFTRKLRGIFIILLTVLFNISCTIIFMWIFDFSLNIHMLVLPCLIVVFTFSDLLHLFYRQSILANQCSSNKELRKKLKHSLERPFLLTSVSNLFGFILLAIVADASTLRSLTITSIFGISIAYVSARFILLNSMRIDEQLINQVRIKRFHSVIRIQPKNNKPMLLNISLAGLTGILLFYAYFNIKIEDQKQDALSENHALTILQSQFFGTKSIDIQIKYADKKYIWDSNTLNKITDIEDLISKQFKPFYINSPATIAKRIHRFNLNNHPKAYKLPSNSSSKWLEKLERLNSMFGGLEVVNPNKLSGRIQFGFDNQPLEDRLNHYDDLQELLKYLSNQNVSFKIGGLDYISDKNTKKYTDNLLVSWSLSVVLIGLLISFILRSTRKGIAVFLVNLVPLLLVLNLMPFFGLNINPQSLFLLTVLSGISVDDSIYIMVEKTNFSGQLAFFPIIVTSIVIAGGLLSFGFSSLSWLSPFLWLFLIGILSALILDIFILPTFKNDDIK